MGEVVDEGLDSGEEVFGRCGIGREGEVRVVNKTDSLLFVRVDGVRPGIGYYERDLEPEEEFTSSICREDGIRVSVFSGSACGRVFLAESDYVRVLLNETVRITNDGFEFQIADELKPIAAAAGFALSTFLVEVGVPGFVVSRLSGINEAAVIGNCSGVTDTTVIGFDTADLGEIFENGHIAYNLNSCATALEDYVEYYFERINLHNVDIAGCFPEIIQVQRNAEMQYLEYKRLQDSINAEMVSIIDNVYNEIVGRVASYNEVEIAKDMAYQSVSLEQFATNLEQYVRYLVIEVDSIYNDIWGRSATYEELDVALYMILNPNDLDQYLDEIEQIVRDEYNKIIAVLSVLSVIS